MKDKITFNTSQGKALLASVSDYLANFVTGSPSGQALERAALRSDAGKDATVKSFVRLHRLLREHIIA